MIEKNDRETALVEAVLFMENDPIDEGTIARICNISKEAVKTALVNIDGKYASADSGLTLAYIGGGVTLSAKREYWDNLKDRYGKRNEDKISRAAMETLAIIAYSQPITRVEIEKTRGVSSADNMMRLLLEKDLIREVGKKDIPGRPVLYGTTKNFLKVFNLKSIADLPNLNESDAEKFELQGEKY